MDPGLRVRGRRRSTSVSPGALNGEDFLFLRRKQLIYFRYHAVGRLLHIIGETFLIVLGDIVVLLQLLDGIETVAADMPHRDLGRLGIFMGDLYQFLAAILVELGNPQPEHLSFGGGT